MQLFNFLLAVVACFHTVGAASFVATTPQNTSTNALSSIAIDSSDNIYLVDSKGPVYKCAAGMASCTAAFSTTSGQFSNINGAALDSKGKLLLADKANVYSCSSSQCSSVFNLNTIIETSSGYQNLYGITFDATYSSFYVANQYDKSAGTSYVINCPYTLATGAVTVGSCVKISNTLLPGYTTGSTTGSIASLRYFGGYLSIITTAGQFYTCKSAFSCTALTLTFTGAATTVTPTDFVADPSIANVIYVSDSANNMIWSCALSASSFSCTSFLATPYARVTIDDEIYGFSPQYMGIDSTRTLHAPDNGPFFSGTGSAVAPYGPYVWASPLISKPTAAPTPKPTSPTAVPSMAPTTKDLALPLGLSVGLCIGGTFLIAAGIFAVDAYRKAHPAVTTSAAPPSTELAVNSA